MCGILGLAGGNLPDDREVSRLRDLMSLRGPDGDGLWRTGGLVLAHRRLAVIEPTPAGHQPMFLSDGSALVYNGEIYNDAEVRTGLLARGRRPASASDAETVLHAMAEWGAGAPCRLRGMFALAYYDAPERRLILARDPLGIKPLYYRLSGGQLAFASDIRAILAGPGSGPRPDLGMLSAYLTTIRTVQRDRTLFEGVRTLRPGEVLVFDLAGPAPRLVGKDRVRVEARATQASEIRGIVEDSVARHLRSDVPVCALLSGGLDSTIIATIARAQLAELFTYCSGAPGGDSSDDFAHARLVAGRLGTGHAEVPVGRELFEERWPWMVETLGIPLSTPNEVAIHEVCRRLRADGKVVALSGEGADELFGGYDRPLSAAAEFFAGSPDAAGTARFLLDSASWVPTGSKAAVLRPEVWRGLEGDATLLVGSEDDWADAREGGGGPMQACLRHQRIVNLTGLLARLDTASMLAGVEGRTPLADAAVAAAAEGLAMEDKFVPPAETKIALRRAFASDLPAEVANRPKASFPLPFQPWVGDHAGVLRASAFAREVFSAGAIEAVAARPGELWRFAWPMINVAMWGRRWWG